MFKLCIKYYVNKDFEFFTDEMSNCDVLQNISNKMDQCYKRIPKKKKNETIEQKSISPLSDIRKSTTATYSNMCVEKSTGKLFNIHLDLYYTFKKIKKFVGVEFIFYYLISCKKNICYFFHYRASGMW